MSQQSCDTGRTLVARGCMLTVPALYTVCAVTVTRGDMCNGPTSRIKSDEYWGKGVSGSFPRDAGAPALCGSGAAARGR